MLENEASHLCKEDIDESNSQYQLVPPNNHRHNEAERAIRTFKEHFIRVLAGEDAKFPMSMCDHLLEKIIINVKILRQSKVHHYLST